VVNTTHQRFPRRARIRTSAEYQAVFSEGIRVSGAFFRCHLGIKSLTGQTTSVQQGHLGLAVSKRVDKSAVGRNKIKRVCREWFRQHQADYLPVNYVLVAKPGAENASAAYLRADLEKVFARSHSLLTKNSVGTMHDQPETDSVSSQHITGDNA
jgi:ribonuclease P protein component